MQNQGLEQLLRCQKNNVLQGFRQTLKTLRKINDSSAAPVPDIHVERPANVKNNHQPLKTLGKTATQPLSYPAVHSSGRDRCRVSQKPLKSLGSSMILEVELV